MFFQDILVSIFQAQQTLLQLTYAHKWKPQYKKYKIKQIQT